VDVEKKLQTFHCVKNHEEINQILSFCVISDIVHRRQIKEATLNHWTHDLFKMSSKGEGFQRPINEWIKLLYE